VSRPPGLTIILFALPDLTVGARLVAPSALWVAVVVAMDGEIRKYPDESSGLLLLASDIGLCTERPYGKLACAGKIIPREALV
jgi:hypothetical protein